MIDRIPRYPGRVEVIPEEAARLSKPLNTLDEIRIALDDVIRYLMEPYLATLIREDEPLVEGTPLIKATFLTDTTAAIYGLSAANATVNNAFAAVPQFAKALVEFGTYTGNGLTSMRNINLGFRPKAVFIARQSGGGTTPGAHRTHALIFEGFSWEGILALTNTGFSIIEPFPEAGWNNSDEVYPFIAWKS